MMNMSFSHPPQVLPAQQSMYSSQPSLDHGKPLTVQPNVVFVGNLSFFCEEAHLYDLFNEYGHVEHVRIVRNDNNTRSLMFGFVTLASAHEAREMERLLNNHLFMGRRMRVAISERRFDGRTITGNEGVQVHVSFCSFFSEQTLRKPTEGFLRRVFMDFGILVDVSVKEYRVYQEQCMQEGYGFITLSSYEDALRIASIVQNLSVDGISLTCSLTHQNNPHSKKHRSPSPSMSSNASVSLLSARSLEGQGLPPMPPRSSPSLAHTMHRSSPFGVPLSASPLTHAPLQQQQQQACMFANFAPSPSHSPRVPPVPVPPLCLQEIPRYASPSMTGFSFSGTQHTDSALGFAQSLGTASLDNTTANNNNNGNNNNNPFGSVSIDSFASSSGSGRESLSSSASSP